jgi:hypothetical protein
MLPLDDHHLNEEGTDMQMGRIKEQGAGVASTALGRDEQAT